MSDDLRRDVQAGFKEVQEQCLYHRKLTCLLFQEFE